MATEIMSPERDRDLPSVLTVEEVATLLRLNRTTAYRACCEHQIPGVRRIGRSIRVSRDAVLQWLREGQRAQRSAKRR